MMSRPHAVHHPEPLGLALVVGTFDQPTYQGALLAGTMLAFGIGAGLVRWPRAVYGAGAGCIGALSVPAEEGGVHRLAVDRNAVPAV